MRNHFRSLANSRYACVTANRRRRNFPKPIKPIALSFVMISALVPIRKRAADNVSTPKCAKSDIAAMQAVQCPLPERFSAAHMGLMRMAIFPMFAQSTQATDHYQ